MKHSKEDLEKAREKVAEIYKDIKKLPIVNLPQVECSVDWGSPKRQGKRSGHMVMGSMSAMIRGETKYQGIDYSKYAIDEFEEDFRLICKDAKIFFYATAREYGLSHIESMVYAYKRNGSSS
jgi:hypothetical protein